MTTNAWHRANLLAVIFAIGVLPAMLYAGPKDGEVPAEPEPGAFCTQFLTPYEFRLGIRRGCVGSFNNDELWFVKRLDKGTPDEQLAAARALWRGRSRRRAEEVIKFASVGRLGGAAYRAFQHDVEAALRPEAILRELKEGDYRWGSWLAYLRPHKDLVPTLLAGLKDHSDMLEETIFALSNCGDPRVYNPLLAYLKDKDEWKASYAARALAFHGDLKAEPELIAALAADSVILQSHVCWALGEIGTTKALPALHKFAKKSRDEELIDIRREAMIAIVRIERRYGIKDPDRWPSEPKAELLATIYSNVSYLNNLAFSPDGRLIASIGSDSIVRFWDPATAECTSAFFGHEHYSFIAFANSTTVATSGYEDEAVRFFDVRTGKEVSSLKVSSAWRHGVSISSDGKLIATSHSKKTISDEEKTHEEKTVKIWEWSTGKEIASIPEGNNVLTFSPDGKVLAVIRDDDDERIWLWDWANKKIVATFRGHTNGVNAAAFSPDGRTFATVGDWTLRIWDLKTGKQTVSCRGDSYIHSLSFNPDGRSIATGEYDGPVRVWDVATGKAIAVLKARGPVAFSPDGKRLATGSVNEGEILLWNAPGRELPIK